MVDDLLPPPMPMMFDLMTPNIPLVADPLFGKQVGQPVGIVQAFLFPGPLAADQGDMRIVANMIQGPVMQIIHVSQRIVKINLKGIA